MRLRRPCEHDRYDTHLFYRPLESGKEFGSVERCPGGEFLPEDALVVEKVEGEWPEWAVKAVSYHDWELDALAVSQVGEPER